VKRLPAALILICATCAAAPAQAQSYEEVQIDAAATARAAKVLDRADAMLLRSAAALPPNRSGNDYSVEGIRALLEGWRSYTISECALVGQVTGGNSAARGQFALICEARRYAARAKTVEGATACIARALRKAPDEDAAECLEALAPLKLDGDFEA